MPAKVTKEDREKYTTLSGGRFPIKNKAQAKSALKLRGHAKNNKERNKIINRAAKFLPKEAEKARKKDKSK